MRITQDLLHKLAEDTVKTRKRSEPDLLSAYLTGSLLEDEPLLGGTTDIDLVLVHKFQIPTPRETVAVTPEVSLDIIHKLKEDYDPYRQLRQDPWLGYPLTRSNILLFDTDHWLEFIQSGVAADFHRGDNVLLRVNKMMSDGRAGWFSLRQDSPKDHTAWLNQYLQILALSANAVTGLISAPLTTRRFLMTFTDRIQALGVPKVLAGFSGLLGATSELKPQLDKSLDGFNQDFQALSDLGNPPAKLSPCRRMYYYEAIRAISGGGAPEHAVWPLLRTWLDVRLAATKPLPGDKAWESLLTALQLTPEHAEQKTEALDAYLDTIEIIIETWADNYG